MLFRKKDIGPISSPRRFPWKTLAGAVIGLVVAAGSFVYLQQYIATNQKTEQVIVPVRDIPPFTVISTGDLTHRTILAGAREPGAVVNVQELAGKMSTTAIYKGEQVRRERLAEPAESDRPVVTVNIDPVRVNGAGPGDIVDVYLVKSEDVPGALLAVDARVVAVKDASGVPIGSNAPVSVAGTIKDVAQVTAKAAAMVTLSVKFEEASQVIRGSANGSKGIVLIKKLKPGGTVMSQPEPVQEQKPKTNQIQKPPQQ